MPARHQTSHADTAIIRKRSDQTGPKTQLGGVHEGLRMFGYQSLTESAVKAAPIAAVPKHSAQVSSSIESLVKMGRGLGVGSCIAVIHPI